MDTAAVQAKIKLAAAGSVTCLELAFLFEEMTEQQGKAGYALL